MRSCNAARILRASISPPPAKSATRFEGNEGVPVAEGPMLGIIWSRSNKGKVSVVMSEMGMSAGRDEQRGGRLRRGSLDLNEGR